MMQANEVRQRFSQIEQTIHQANQACQRAGEQISSDLKECVQKLEQRSGKASQELQQASNDEAIRQCVDELEELGDKAKAACERSGNIDQQVRSAVLQAHQELSQLKHQIH